MAHKRTMQIESHDAAGYENDYMDFADCDDGYGNNVAHGDLSVQRMVERGSREFNWPAGHSHVGTDPKAYDTKPFQSEVQHRFFRAAEARGDLPKGTASRWAHETPGGVKGLPERKG